MKIVLDHCTGFINRCADCKIGRHGECPWMQQYKTAAEKYKVQENEVFEQRLLRLYKYSETDSCDEQRSLDFFYPSLKLVSITRRFPIRMMGYVCFYQDCVS